MKDLFFKKEEFASADFDSTVLEFLEKNKNTEMIVFIIGSKDSKETKKEAEKIMNRELSNVKLGIVEQFGDRHVYAVLPLPKEPK